MGTVHGSTTGNGSTTERGDGWTLIGDVRVRHDPAAGTVTVVDGSAAGSRDASTGPARRVAVVGQLGRRFQAEHPDVQVLVDQGRYLLVAVPDSGFAEPDHDGCSWAVRPLVPGAALLQTRDTTAARRTAVPWVQTLVDRVDADRIAADLATLAAHPTRHSTSATFAAAATWARDALTALGYATRSVPVTVGAGSSQNLVADRAGRAGADRRLVLVTAHLDSVNLSGPSAPAPGADDNASGSAGVLEVARVLADHPARHDLRLVLFGGEEQGLLGSRQYVASLPADERARITAVVNMDMVACRNIPQASVLIEGSAVSQALIDDLVTAAATYTGLAVTTSTEPFASDHVPFLDAGIPAVLTIEGADSSNTAIHSAADTVDRTDAALAAEIVRMNVAAVAAAVGKEAPMSIIDPLPIQPVPVLPPHLLPSLWRQVSGRYEFNGGAQARDSAAGDGDRHGRLDDPSVVRDQPVLVQPPITRPPVIGPPVILPPWLRLPRFTLHVDVDGTDPLQVVSGSVARPVILAGDPVHFIGRVTSSTRSGWVRHLVVGDFTFPWPGSSRTVDRVELAITSVPFDTPSAEVTFVETSTGHRWGPYEVDQTSRWFREIEIEVDVEEGSAGGTSYHTHTHPDRPADLPAETLTLESVFARAGLRVTQSASSNTIATSEAGTNSRWSYQELHDSMQLHWSAFANVPQWKLWLFMAGLADSDSLGGVMFDGDIDEPGGVDRQGTAVFTRCEFFHGAGGQYPVDNPPAAQAAQRELFFDVIHESGHAFNLAHSFQKQSAFGPGDVAWPAPSWMPLVQDDQALSWMNYPDQASPGSGLNATWFYDRFRFRFDDGENLFLRHAPARHVRMGDDAWFHNHGRAERGLVDRRLELALRTHSAVLELGEPVFVELRLRNVSGDVLLTHRSLDPADGMVEVTVTAPDGTRQPFLPFAHNRSALRPTPLAPGETVHHAQQLTMGTLGFPFKQPGPYRVEACYTASDGTQAAAILHLEVRTPSEEAARAVRPLFEATVGRVLMVGGSRVLGEVNETIDWVRERLGDRHPAGFYLSTARALPMLEDFKVVPGDAERVEVVEADPERVTQELAGVVQNLEESADAMGSITVRRAVETYVRAAAMVDERAKAREAKEGLVTLLEGRGAPESVLADVREGLAVPD